MLTCIGSLQTVSQSVALLLSGESSGSEIPATWLGSMPLSLSNASKRFSRSRTNLSFDNSLFLRGGFGGRIIHGTLCLTQAPHGFCLSHPTFRSEHRMQAKFPLGGGMFGEAAVRFAKRELLCYERISEVIGIDFSVCIIIK